MRNKRRGNRRSSDQSWLRERDNQGRFTRESRRGSGPTMSDRYPSRNLYEDRNQNYYTDRGNYGRGGYGSYDDNFGNTQRGYGNDPDSFANSQNRDGYSDHWRGYRHDAGNERQQNSRTESHRGKGPKGYQRSDERIQEDINDRLSYDSRVDASDIEVIVENGEVTLNGKVSDRRAKRIAEDLADKVSGVKNVENRIRLNEDSNSTKREKEYSRSDSVPNSNDRTKIRESIS